MVSPAVGAMVSGGVVIVTGTASDALSGVTLVEVSTNGGLTWMAATGTTTWSYAFTPSDGAHDVRARATDAAGNVQAIGAPHLFTVDNTAPACAIAVDDGATYALVAGTSSWSYTFTPPARRPSRAARP